MFRFVPHLSEKKNYKKLSEEINELVNVFVKGEELTNLEKVIEIEYLTTKYNKKAIKQKYLYNVENIILTENDCLKLMCKRDMSIDFTKIKFDDYKTQITDIFKVC